MKLSNTQIDELCRLRSDLRSGLTVGSTLRHQSQIDNYIKVLDEILGAPYIEPMRPSEKKDSHYDYWHRLGTIIESEADT